MHIWVDINGLSSRNIFSPYRYNRGAENNVKIDYGNGYISWYMYLNKIRVKKSQTVKKG